MNNGKWITLKDGRRILIKPKQVVIKDTNFYMNNTIRGKNNNDKKFQLSNENIDKLIESSISEWDDNYALNYITKMTPDDFLKLTANQNVMEMLEAQKFDLDLDILNRKGSWIFLDIDFENNVAVSHEGRHRMYALKNAGYNQVDVVVFPRNYEKYNAKTYNNIKIKAQDEISDDYVLFDKITPVSKANADKIRKREY